MQEVEENRDMDKLNKLSLPATIIVVSLIIGGFYYASETNKQNSIERQQELKIQEEKTKTDQVKQGQEQAKQALNTCIDEAEESNHNFWNRECEAKGLLSKSCIDFLDQGIEVYYDKNISSDEIIKKKKECSCSLPQYNADRLGKILQDDKDECFKKYPQK